MRKRAIITQWGLGANLAEDAIYPSNLGDETGKPLDGANNYTLHFNKGETPPADAFWSVTLYDAEGFQVANPLDRFNLSSRAARRERQMRRLQSITTTPAARINLTYPSDAPHIGLAISAT